MLAWAYTGYRVWANERKRVILLSGRPQVVLKEYPGLNSPLLFQVENISTDIATNVSVREIKHENLIMRFDQIGSIGNRIHENTSCVVRIDGFPEHKIDSDSFFILLSRSEDEGIFTLPTNLEFSNYGCTRRWSVDYVLVCDAKKKRIACKPGKCLEITAGV
jgi:hypothetical protein